MEPYEREIEFLRALDIRVNRLSSQIQLAIAELQKRIKLRELVAAQGLPPYLPSSALPAETEEGET